ncbi:hypothetical protein [Pseudoduganella albidiflava]|uniref:Uncharacterized protein n=1 Tax=Pseudoduganella albidiflava TaxID=321983 RepID=A0A411WUQ0_9BURK|nr:hypothetical protein [Pseudoduganella albidiflava]QBI00503.1 hypothetical protein EYF70_06270 [Pseudoduganella albidiflava]GGY32809.1 hypothetical protein GCM10007387_13810 [Pseudoduganella albidiflava]
MRAYMISLSFSVLLTSSMNAAAQKNAAAIYTNLSGNACSKAIDDVATGAHTLDCPGIAGYRLQVLLDDERNSLNVVTPGKRVLPLDYWEVVTRGFSTLGEKAEWRIAKTRGRITPIAIIVRVDTFEQGNPEQPKRVPMLVIARIFHDTACVTGAMNANVRDASVKARRIADDEHLPCLLRESNPHEAIQP